jgi:hypothetical protein
MVSGQVILYQSERLVVPAGALNVWASVESPLVGELAPTMADEAPECAVELLEVEPVLVQPASPLSNPPLVIPGTEGPRTVSEMAVVWVALAPVPVIVRA